jgi:hypothetical protein
MKCPKCQSELFEKAKFCTECGNPVGSDEQGRFRANTLSPLAGEKITGTSGAGEALGAPTGLKRTLSTELVARQAERGTSVELNALVESRTWEAGEIIIRNGDRNRDLLFLIKGHVEILTSPEGGNLVLNEVDAPHILGDIAFLSGLPRTATVMAKTHVSAFVLRYDNFKKLFGEFPEWLHLLLSSFTSGIKSLHYKIAELEGQAEALKKRSD